MPKPENTPQLRTDALMLQLELECHCYCHALSSISRPCDSCRAAGMIGRLIKALTLEAGAERADENQKAEAARSASPR